MLACYFILKMFNTLVQYQKHLIDLSCDKALFQKKTREQVQTGQLTMPARAKTLVPATPVDPGSNPISVSLPSEKRLFLSRAHKPPRECAYPSSLLSSSHIYLPPLHIYLLFCIHYYLNIILTPCA